MAEEIAEQGDTRHGFSSSDELMLHCDRLSADRLNLVRDRLVFVPL